MRTVGCLWHYLWAFVDCWVIMRCPIWTGDFEIVKSLMCLAFPCLLWSFRIPPSERICACFPILTSIVSRRTLPFDTHKHNVYSIMVLSMVVIGWISNVHPITSGIFPKSTKNLCKFRNNRHCQFRIIRWRQPRRLLCLIFALNSHLQKI